MRSSRFRPTLVISPSCLITTWTWSWSYCARPSAARLRHTGPLWRVKQAPGHPLRRRFQPPGDSCHISFQQLKTTTVKNKLTTTGVFPSNILLIEILPSLTYQMLPATVLTATLAAIMEGYIQGPITSTRLFEHFLLDNFTGDIKNC